MKRICFIGLLLVAPLCWAAETHVLLVPGTLNRLIGNYFCDDIVNVFREAGVEVSIAKNLSPLGSYLENGTLLQNEMDRVCGEKNLWLVAHSAGGLYSLAAIRQSRCRVHGLVAIASPLEGAELVTVFRPTLAWRLFQMLAPLLWFKVNIFRDFIPERMPDFYKNLGVLPRGFQFYSVPAEQPVATRLSEMWDAEFLNPHLSALGYEINGPNDGLVSVRSARGNSVRIQVEGGREAQPISLEPPVRLDHQEQFRDQRYFNFLHRNASLMRSRQRELYQRIAELIRQ